MKRPLLGSAEMKLSYYSFGVGQIESLEISRLLKLGRNIKKLEPLQAQASKASSYLTKPKFSSFIRNY